MEDIYMENNEMNNVVEMKKETKKFWKGETFGKVVKIGKRTIQILTPILTIANTVFLVWTCASSVENEVNADVMDEYNQMKELEVKTEPQTEIAE